MITEKPPKIKSHGKAPKIKSHGGLGAEPPKLNHTGVWGQSPQN